MQSQELNELKTKLFDSHLQYSDDYRWTFSWTIYNHDFINESAILQTAHGNIKLSNDDNIKLYMQISRDENYYYSSHKKVIKFVCDEEVDYKLNVSIKGSNGWTSYNTENENLILSESNNITLIEIICDVNLGNVCKGDWKNFKYSRIEKVSILNDLLMLLKTGAGSDVVLLVEEKEIPAHKAILAARSKVFLAMFTNDMVEKFTNSVKISDTSYDIMDLLLQYMYSGVITLDDSNIIDVFIGADRYVIDSLQDMCEMYICKNLSVDNVFNMLTFTNDYNLDHLRTCIIDFIQAHFKFINVMKHDFNMSLKLLQDVTKEMSSKCEAINDIHVQNIEDLDSFVMHSWNITEPKMDNTFYTWVINNFRSSLVFDNYNLSVKFTINNTNWRLTLEKIINDSYIHCNLTLRLLNFNTGVLITGFMFSIIDCNDKLYGTVSTQKLSLQVNQTHTVNKFIFIDAENSSILDSILNNGALKIYCQINIKSETEECDTPYNIKSYAIKSYKSTLYRDIQSLFDTQNLYDFTFKLSKKKEVKVHKSLLAARNEKLAEMFKDCANKNVNTMDIKKYKPIVFEEMLRFLYGCQVKYLETINSDLLVLAHDFEIEALKNMCQESLCNSLTVDNAVNILSLSDKCKADKLEKYTYRFILNNIQDIDIDLLCKVNSSTLIKDAMFRLNNCNSVYIYSDL